MSDNDYSQDECKNDPTYTTDYIVPALPLDDGGDGGGSSGGSDIVLRNVKTASSTQEAYSTQYLNGVLDGIDHDIENLTELIPDETELAKAKNLPEYVIGNDAPAAIVVGGSGAIGNTKFALYNLPAKNVKSGALRSVDFRINYATPSSSSVVENAGIISGPDKLKLDELPAIKSLGTGLTLSDEGELSAEGGGEGGKLYSEYGTNEDGALTQKFVSEKLNGKAITIGQGATGSSSSNDQSVAIGNGARATTQHSVAIGKSAYAYGNQSVALGNEAYVDSQLLHSVALGPHARPTREGEVAIGHPTYESETLKHRFLSFVRAGELDEDAVNLKQMKDYVAENAGGEPMTVEEFNLAWEAA